MESKTTHFIWEINSYTVDSVSYSHQLQINLLPAKTRNNIDHIQRNFLWGSATDQRKIHHINWNKVVSPKQEGDLGLYKATGNYIALLSSLLWRYLSNSESLWAKIIKGKYISTQRRNPMGYKTNDSYIWKSSAKTYSFFSKGVMTQNHVTGTFHTTRPEQIKSCDASKSYT